MSLNSQNSISPEESQELVARQAILGRQDEIIGYELFARNESSGPMEDPFLCSARVLIKTFSVYNLESLLGGKPAFINFTNSNFDEKSLEPVFQKVMDETGLGFGKLAQPVRLMLTGKTVSPGIFEMIEVLGKEEAIARLRRGIVRMEAAARSAG